MSQRRRVFGARIIASGALAMLALLVAGVVLASNSTGGLQCRSSEFALSTTYEPDLATIEATTPRGAIAEWIAGDGAEVVGLDGVPEAGLANSFEKASTQPVDEFAQAFEYKDAAGNTVSQVVVEPVGDGRFYLSATNFCAPEK